MTYNMSSLMLKHTHFSSTFSQLSFFHSTV